MAPDRLVPAATVPLLDIDDAVAELRHAAELGLHVVSLPTGVPEGVDDWHYDTWEPLWAAAEDTGMVLGFHIGSDGTADGPTVFRGPGGAVLNYVETTYGGQKVATKLVASGALDRHPDLRVLISEGGATWVPFLGDRMNEGYRQHGMFVRPTLSMLPKELLYRQVYASFQHDESAPAALTAMGYPNVMWGSDYPHLEGTYGHTQKTLHELFDDLDPAASERIRFGAFKELFPHVSDPPAETNVARDQSCRSSTSAGALTISPLYCIGSSHVHRYAIRVPEQSAGSRRVRAPSTPVSLNVCSITSVSTRPGSR